jgi:hypothetical protein
MIMNLKPQDVLVVLKLLVLKGQSWNYAMLSTQLGMMSVSQIHAAVKRAVLSRLAIQNGDVIVPMIRNLEEFVIHGLPYVFVPERGGLVRGIPTAHAAAPLMHQFAPSDEFPPVWPDPEGAVRGMAFSPLHKLAPKAALVDEKLYELLALLDAIRGGRAREKHMAVVEWKERMERYA